VIVNVRCCPSLVVPIASIKIKKEIRIASTGTNGVNRIEANSAQRFKDVMRAGELA
jgi:hypothetical protein